VLLLLPASEELLLSELVPLLLELPGDSAPPVADPVPDNPKYENTLWRQLGCDKSVVASKFGAD